MNNSVSASSSKSVKKLDNTRDIKPLKGYDVEQILMTKRFHGAILFLVLWKSYPWDECTWEPRENLDCPDILEAFLYRWAYERQEMTRYAKSRVPKSVLMQYEECSSSSKVQGRKRSRTMKRSRQRDSSSESDIIFIEEVPMERTPLATIHLDVDSNANDAGTSSSTSTTNTSTNSGIYYNSNVDGSSCESSELHTSSNLDDSYAAGTDSTFERAELDNSQGRQKNPVSEIGTQTDITELKN